MKASHNSPRPRSRVKSRSNTLLYTVFVSIILFMTFFYFYTKEEPVSAHLNNHQFLNDNTVVPIEKIDGFSKDSSEFSLQLEMVTAAEDDSVSPAAIEHTDSLSTAKLSGAQSAAGHPLKEEEYDNTVVEEDARRLILKLNTFYEHLDQQPYMKDFNLYRPSKSHFSNLLRNLVKSPPVVTNETNDLFTLLKNTAHFFRILGKENIVVLKGILDREKASFEEILKTFYALTYYPEALEKEYGLSLPQDVLYDYAGFFLNTMGGRLYLFRRDSASRMTVSFYAIKIIDKAIKEGNNRHGIHLLPAIEFLINEMENTGRNLVLKEEYLETLYGLEEKYH